MFDGTKGYRAGAPGRGIAVSATHANAVNGWSGLLLADKGLKMKDPWQNRRNTLTILFLVLLAVVLIYVIYNLLGGDWAALTRQTGSGSENPLQSVVNSLRALGEGLTNIFANMFR